ncbi:hypothetical protein OAC47_01185 [Planktomarina temperata]|nr:hypothetical protein [Planktomarina temperata]
MLNRDILHSVHQDAYSVAPDIRLKALELVEQDKLSERGLTAILGV